MRNDVSVRLPATNASIPSFTEPQVFGITLTPAETSMSSSGHEMAPQMSTVIPISMRRLVLSMGSVCPSSCATPDTSRARPKSHSSNRLATSNIGEILSPCIGIASFME